MSMRKKSRKKKKKKKLCRKRQVNSSRWVQRGNLDKCRYFHWFFVLSIITWIEENNPKIFAKRFKQRWSREIKPGKSWGHREYKKNCRKRIIIRSAESVNRRTLWILNRVWIRSLLKGFLFVIPFHRPLYLSLSLSVYSLSSAFFFSIIPDCEEDKLFLKRLYLAETDERKNKQKEKGKKKKTTWRIWRQRLQWKKIPLYVFR